MQALFIKFNDKEGNSYTVQVGEILMIINTNSRIEVVLINEEIISIDNETYKMIDNSLDDKQLLI
jgi:hypothetical protein